MEHRRRPNSDFTTDPTSPIRRRRKHSDTDSDPGSGSDSDPDIGLPVPFHEVIKTDSDTDSDSGSDFDPDIGPSVPSHDRIKTDSEILAILKTIPSAPLTLSDLPRPSICRNNHFFPEDTGVIFGRLIFSNDGCMIDCTKIGKSGISIPSFIDRVGDMQSDALFILLVEKFDTYLCLVEDGFYNRFPCIIVRTKGQPDVATRLFLRKMKMELRLHVLALVDSDPNGLKCVSLYGSVSKRISYNSSNLTTLDIKWLGIRPSDLDKYKIPEHCRLRMTKRDIKAGNALLEDDFVKKNPRWIEELTLMVKTKQMVEIEALSYFGFRYLTEVYLPLKLQQQDWI